MNAIHDQGGSTAMVDASEPQSLLNVIAKAARDPSVDIAKLTALIELQERVAASQARAQYLHDLSLVAGEVEPVRKDANNPTFNRRYATLGAMDAALRPVYARHGFSVSYGTAPAPAGSIGVSCTIAHRGGHIETLALVAPSDTTTGGRARTPVQAIGSTVTYLKRYLLGMAFSVTFAEEDDDGEGSRKPEPPTSPKSERPKPDFVRYRRGAEPPKSTLPFKGDPKPDPEPTHVGDTVEYPFATKNGGKAFGTGTDWIAEWRRTVEWCKANDALERLQEGADRNRDAIAAVAKFDPSAAADVKSMLAQALSALPSREEMARMENGDE